MRLNDKTCRSFPPQAKPYKASDGNGLYLLIKPNGGKYWRMNYRIHGKYKTLAIGVYPDVSLKLARSKRDEARKKLANGMDPAHEKQKQKLIEQIQVDNSFEAIAREWLEKRVSHLSLKHRTRIQSVLENDLFPKLGRSPAKSLTAPELLLAIRSIEDRGSAYTAERTRQWCSQIFRYAIACGYLERDIARDLGGAIATHRSKNHAYLREKDLPDFLAKLSHYPGHTQTQIALKLTTLTFVRPQELCHARWSEFDLQESLWRIPAHRMKMRTEHIVPLSRQVKDLLAQLHQIHGEGDFLLPSYKNPAVPMHPDSLLRGLHRMGYKGKATAHGFRATASTILNENGFNRDVIERQLAHTERNRVRAAYNHAEYLPERRQLMQWWADHIDGLEGSHGVPGSSFSKQSLVTAAAGNRTGDEWLRP
ncbi:tyrosine-type recombinase/integrase [Luteolibacter pohnpeiensis]|uniref:Tyrosine-type recombinase/integrase n=1 Tax=Luteolibacter pohnpeiensis TaxID=454153 RepID=A0A934VVP6_9BACT|nr:integrase arm-type DNA-binding domain-containing protein [Luteolibacter pohnpeiensis]MBK1883777.1 tyrosine-type recombinase/integrase [Luteolibacter pohnpeiensis]